MSAFRRRSLLQDLAALLSKYPQEEWRALISALNDEKLRQEAIVSIEALMPLARTTTNWRKHSNSGRKPIENASSILRALREEEPEKAQLLQSIRHELQQKAFLPTAKSIRDFATVCGMKEQLPQKRDQAINAVIGYLASQSYEEIKYILGQKIQGQRDFGAEYERWVELILGRQLDRPAIRKDNMLPMETKMDESPRVVHLTGFANGDWEAKEEQGKLFYRPIGSKDKWQEGHPPSISPAVIRDVLRRFEGSAKKAR